MPGPAAGRFCRSRPAVCAAPGLFFPSAEDQRPCRGEEAPRCHRAEHGWVARAYRGAPCPEARVRCAGLAPPLGHRRGVELLGRLRACAAVPRRCAAGFPVFALGAGLCVGLSGPSSPAAPAPRPPAPGGLAAGAGVVRSPIGAGIRPSFLRRRLRSRVRDARRPGRRGRGRWLRRRCARVAGLGELRRSSGRPHRSRAGGDGCARGCAAGAGRRLRAGGAAPRVPADPPGICLRCRAGRSPGARGSRAAHRAPPETPAAVCPRAARIGAGRSRGAGAPEVAGNTPAARSPAPSSVLPDGGAAPDALLSEGQRSVHPSAVVAEPCVACASARLGRYAFAELVNRPRRSDADGESRARGRLDEHLQLASGVSAARGRLAFVWAPAPCRARGFALLAACPCARSLARVQSAAPCSPCSTARPTECAPAGLSSGAALRAGPAAYGPSAAPPLGRPALHRYQRESRLVEPSAA